MRALTRFEGIVLVTAALIVTTSAVYYVRANNAQPVIRSDGQAYYAYLRLYLIHHALDFERVPELESKLPGWFPRSPRTGRRAALYPIGTALAELPFFLAGHAVAVVANWPQDGLSAPYQWSIFAGGLCWLLVGSIATWSLLAARFTARIACIATAVTVLGTNLLHYSVAEPSMSHVYAFGSVGLMLWLGDRFWAAPSVRRALVLGMAAGLVVSIRNYDGLFVPLVLYHAFQQPDVAKRYGMLFLLGALVMLSPQLAAGTYYLGAPWASTYGNAPFFWTHPQLWNVLFSVKKGWWFWAPIGAIGCAGLLAGLRSEYRWFCGLSLLGIGATVYVVAAWVDWAMGASFGHRAFVDCLPVVAVGLGLVLRYGGARPLVPLLLLMLTLYNLFLTWGYWNGHISAFGATPRSVYRLVSLPFAWMVGSTPNDSTSPRGLAAQVVIREVRRIPYFLVVTASARNTGSALWLSDLSKGQVYLDVRPFNDTRCTGPSPWEVREPIVTDVPPSGSVTISAYIPLHKLTTPFHYLCVEMVGVAWFRDVGPSLPAVFDTGSMTGGVTP